jgi:bla regulator protein blaR1
MIQVLLNSLWQGAFVVAIAAGVIALVPQRNAATRYGVWFVALAAMALLPLSGMVSFGDSSAIPSAVIRTTSVVSHVASAAANATGFWLAALWLAGIGVCAMRFALSFVRIAAIMRGSVPAPHLGEGVFTSASIAVPVAAGFIHPMVIVPDEIAAALDRADLEGIVAHERAHIRRRDILGNLVARIVESLLFFNPWVYVIGRQLVREREAACDDWAVLSAIDPDRYASCLANLARRAHYPSPLLTPSAIGSTQMLVGRIARLLNGKAAQVKTNYVIVTGAVALFAALGFAFNTPNGLASGGSAVVASSANCTADPMVLKPVPPQIPDADAKAHPHASVTLAVIVSAGGRASSIMIVKSSGDQTIDIAAVHAARDSTYAPEIRNCKAVSGGKFLFQVEGP